MSLEASECKTNDNWKDLVKFFGLLPSLLHYKNCSEFNSYDPSDVEQYSLSVKR